MGLLGKTSHGAATVDLVMAEVGALPALGSPQTSSRPCIPFPCYHI